MSTHIHDHPSIPSSPDLSRSSSSGHPRTSSARPSGSRPSQCSPSHIDPMPHTEAYNTPSENQQLIISSHGSRLTRPSTLSPGPSSLPITPLHSAISEQHSPYTPDQDVLRVPELLNYRSISHHPGLTPNPGHQVSSPASLESYPLSSSSTRHAAINDHAARLRTSHQVFSNISDLASHYGIPQFLPVAPRTIPRRTTDSEEIYSPQLPESFSSSSDLANLCSNYLNMLSQNPGESRNVDIPTENLLPMAVSAEVTDAEAIRSLMDVLNGTTPELQTSNDLNEYLTSPLIDSPFDDDLLATPAVGTDIHADIITSPLMGDFGVDSFGQLPSLFGEFNDAIYENSKSSQPEPAILPRLPNLDHMYSLETPITPFIDSPSTSPSHEEVPSHPSQKRNVTGTRKNIMPDSLVPIDAPTQSRKYLTPSTTSRKELPATWRRKRLRTVGPGEEEDQLVEEGLTPTQTEQEQIEAKRRQNTIAARRSRKRKLEYQRELEQNLEQYKREGEVWKQLAMTCQALLRSHHIECPEFPDS